MSYSDKPKEIKDIHDKFKVASYTKMKSSPNFVSLLQVNLIFMWLNQEHSMVYAAGEYLSNSGGSIDMNGEKIYYGKKDFKNPGNF